MDDIRDHPLWRTACRASDLELWATEVALCERRDELVAEGRPKLAEVWHQAAMMCAAVRDERRAMNRRMEEAAIESLGIKVWHDAPDPKG